MYSDEATVIKMLRNGAKEFVLKNADPGKTKRSTGFHC
jgi:DNA-binding NarL/FixJ family response regulator